MIATMFMADARGRINAGFSLRLEGTARDGISTGDVCTKVQDSD